MISICFFDCNIFIKDPIKNTYDLNLEFIISDFKLIGKELVEKVEIKKSCSIFQ